MQINVTENDINNGIRHSPHHCPIACAIDRNLDAASYSSVDCEEVSIYVDYARYLTTVDLPDHAIQFISDFDYGRKVKPFTFDIDITI